MSKEPVSFETILDREPTRSILHLLMEYRNEGLRPFDIQYALEDEKGKLHQKEEKLKEQGQSRKGPSFDEFDCNLRRVKKKISKAKLRSMEQKGLISRGEIENRHNLNYHLRDILHKKLKVVKQKGKYKNSKYLITKTAYNAGIKSRNEDILKLFSPDKMKNFPYGSREYILHIPPSFGFPLELDRKKEDISKATKEKIRGLSKKRGPRYIKEIIEAKEDREKLTAAVNITTRTLTDTKSLPEESRKKVLKAVEEKKITADKVRDRVRELKEFPEDKITEKQKHYLCGYIDKIEGEEHSAIEELIAEKRIIHHTIYGLPELLYKKLSKKNKKKIKENIEEIEEKIEEIKQLRDREIKKKIKKRFEPLELINQNMVYCFPWKKLIRDIKKIEEGFNITEKNKDLIHPLIEKAIKLNQLILNEEEVDGCSSLCDAWNQIYPIKLPLRPRRMDMSLTLKGIEKTVRWAKNNTDILNIINNEEIAFVRTKDSYGGESNTIGEGGALDKIKDISSIN